MGDNYYGFIYLWENTHPKAIIHKKYIGQHIGTVDDGYIGSGAIFIKRFYSKKYRGCWKRKILQYCNDVDALNAAEKNWILSSNALVDPVYCNIREGGKNGKLGKHTRRKLSESLKGRSAWNKGKKGEYKQSQQTILNRVTARADNMLKLYEKDNKQILKYLKQNKWVKAAEIPEILYRSCTASVYKKRIKILIEQNKIKMYSFGYNDIRYVQPNFSFESIILNLITVNKSQTARDICNKLCTQFNINNGKYKVQGILQQLQKQNKIKQYREYRKNYYCLIDSNIDSNYNPYTI